MSRLTAVQAMAYVRFDWQIPPSFFAQACELARSDLRALRSLGFNVVRKPTPKPKAKRGKGKR